MQHLESILRKIEEANLMVKPKKCHFGAAYVSYLGHVVGGEEVRMEKSKVEAVQRFAIPRSKKDVRAFLGISSSPYKLMLQIKVLEVY